MVLKSEACCPKCFVRHQFVFRLRFDGERNEFVCPHDASHVFVEGEDGYCALKLEIENIEDIGKIENIENKSTDR